MVSKFIVFFLSTCIGDNSQPSQSNMSASKAAPHINRKQTQVEVDGQIQKSIPTYLKAALWQCFERMFGKHTVIESLALRPAAVRLRPPEAKKGPHLPWKFAFIIAVVIFIQYLRPLSIPLKGGLYSIIIINFIVVFIISIMIFHGINRPLPVKNWDFKIRPVRTTTMVKRATAHDQNHVTGHSSGVLVWYYTQN